MLNIGDSIIECTVKTGILLAVRSYQSDIGTNERAVHLNIKHQVKFQNISRACRGLITIFQKVWK